MLLNKVIDSLSSQDIPYCHWKSNLTLGKVYKGEVEFDFLVAKAFVTKFETAILCLGFKRTSEPHVKHLPGIHHFYGYDIEHDIVIHIHAFYVLITGESIAKNYHLPLELALLHEPVYQDGIPTPSKPVQLVTSVIRMMIKYGSLIEIPLAYRDQDATIDELKWLIGDDHDLSKAIQHLERMVPEIKPALFRRAVAALLQREALLKRIILGKAFKSRLKSYRRYREIKVIYLTLVGVMRTALRKLGCSAAHKKFPSGGAVIAFVGPEATGKTTLVSVADSFLKRFVWVELTHLGKPPATLFSLLPNFFLPILRKAFPDYKTSEVEKVHSRAQQAGIIRMKELLLAVRALIIASDRRALAARVFRNAAQGSIVICDRYPSQMIGASDSPRLETSDQQGVLSAIYNYFVKIERKIYATIAPPDYVIWLTVPVDIAVARNAQRQKLGKEDEDYVRRRHKEIEKMSFPSSLVFKLSTDKPLAESIREVHQIMWDLL